MDSAEALVPDVETVVDSGQRAVPDSNGLQQSWNTDGRHYEKSNGMIEVGGRSYQFRVSFMRLPDMDARYGRSVQFPFGRRVMTEVAPDLERRNDIIVPVFPGWGETSAQFEGDFLNLLLEVLHEAGYKNPKIIGINCSGRGTPEYLREENRIRISGVGLKDEIYDADEIARMLITRDYFGDKNYRPDVAVIGHSMGYLNSVGFLNVLNHREGPEGGGREDLRVKKLLAMMPAVDGPFAMVRAKFLWAVRKQIMPAVRQTMKGEGSLELSVDDYHRIMFGDKDFRDPEHYSRSVPDSARRFLELTLNRRRRFDHVFKPGGTGDGVDVMVLKGGRDRLIPDNAVSDLPNLIRERDLTGLYQVEDLPDLSHAVPFRLRDAQRAQIMMALGKFFRK